VGKPESTMTFEERVSRLEARQELHDLVCKYAIAIDARDLNMIVDLYVDDIRVGESRGRLALAAQFDKSLRQFTASSHQITGQVVEFIDSDNALGIVACRVEHEVAADWVTAVIHYHDKYQRRAGRWYLRGRVQARLYATASSDPPVGEAKIRWPGTEPMAGNFHEAYPSWAKFWETGQPSGEPAPDVSKNFVSRLRRGRALPRPPPYMFHK
jgi:hypothetical protein